MKFNAEAAAMLDADDCWGESSGEERMRVQEV